MKTHKYLLIIALAALASLFFTGCNARMSHTMYGPAGTTYVEASTDGYYYGAKPKHKKPKKVKKPKAPKPPKKSKKHKHHHDD